MPARPSAPCAHPFRWSSRERDARPSSARSADPVRAYSRAAQALGRLDENRSRPDCLRGAIGGIWLDWRTLRAGGSRALRSRDPLTRGRFVVDRRRRAGPAASPRGILSHFGGVRIGDREHEVEVRACHRDWDERRPGAQSAANADGTVRAGEGRASGRIARGARLRVVDAIFTGVHEPGERSHGRLDSDRRSRQSEVAKPPTLETTMQVAADRTDASTAIQTDLRAIFASLELSRSTWLITSLSPGGGEKMSKHSVRAGDIGGLARSGSLSSRRKREGGRGGTFPSSPSKRPDWTASGSIACCRAKGSKATLSMPRRF